MGCCDSKERKDKDQKFYDESFDEGSTKFEQDDFKISLMKKTLQRREQDKQTAQTNLEMMKSNTIQNGQNKSNNASFLNNSNNNIVNDLINCSERQNSNQKIKNQGQCNDQEEDIEERKSVANTEYHTPPHNPSEIPLSYQDDSFMLDFQLNPQPKAYMEFDPHNRRTLIKSNFEEQSDQLMRSGSVPIYLKNSKAFIITNSGQNFDLKQFLEETKQALETLQETQQNLINDKKNTPQEVKESSSSISDSSSDEEGSKSSISDSSFESVKNVFDADFDSEVNQPIGQNNKQLEIKYFYQLDDLQNLQVISAQQKKLKPEQRWDYLNVEDMLTPKEQNIFNQLKEYFIDFIDYPKKSEISDHYLLRFLKAKKFDLNITKKFLETHLNWRQAEKIDLIFNDFRLEECQQIKKYYPHGLHFTDKQGRPVYIERLGKLNLNKLFEVVTQERLVKYYIQFYEKIIKYVFQQCTSAKGQQVDKMVVILDCKDISLRVDQITSFLKTAVSITKENYPEILHKMYIINTGMMVNLAWKGVSLLLGEKTKKKISMLGSKFIHELEEEIPKENIPRYLGGKCTCKTENCINENYGPCP
ncbi:hypothetical protein ABPG74_002503 [Tetrahymena malaccensis]